MSKKLKDLIQSQLQGQLIVSCQALADEPLSSSFIMGKMALAAYQGGAAGIRANTTEDIIAIRNNVNLPIIGIIKRKYTDSEIFITATMTEVDELMTVTPEIIAIDARDATRPNNLNIADFYHAIRNKYPNLLLMADCSTLLEMQHADSLGFDFIATTLVGYTKSSQLMKIETEDFALIKQAVSELNKPIIAEGNINTPEKARRVLELGCFSVVVGSAITRPKWITKQFTKAIAT